MHAVDLKQDQFERVFGPRSEERTPGRSRRCRFCGDWHSLSKPWPHNCRSEAPPRSDHPAPMIAPAFQPFKTGLLPEAEIINSRREKINYMDKNELVEWDAGVAPEPEPSERREKEIYAEQIKRFVETDPLNIEPIDNVGETDLDGSSEVIVDDIPVIKDVEPPK